MTVMDLNPLWISLKTALLATAITFILGIAAARWMAGRDFGGKSLLDGIFILPLVLPPTVVGFILLYIFGRNAILGALFFELGRPIVFSWSATVISAVVVAFPLMYQTARGAFEQIDANIEDAARTLGASEWTVFWHITIPLAWPGIAAGTILAFARSLGEFGATLMLAGNIPGKTQTIPIAIYFLVQAGKSEQAITWVLIILIISLASIVALNYWRKYQQRRLKPVAREVYSDA
ncbi:molybdate ABC transporter permease subunit [Syntrophomonas curvata]